LAKHSLAGLFAIFSKVHKFVQNSVLSARSVRFLIFAPGAPLFRNFQEKAQVCSKQRFHVLCSLCKTAFLAQDQHVLSFSHSAHFFLIGKTLLGGFISDF